MDNINIEEINSIIWHLRNSMNNGDTSKCAGSLEECVYNLIGCKPNPEIEPKFKVGDRIVKRNSISNSWIISSVSSEYYGIKLPNGIEGIGVLPVSEQDDYELLPNKFDITTLKPFDKVLVRDNNKQKWTVDMFSFYDKTLIYPFNCVGHYVNQCIPYESNEHLLGATDDCDDYFKTWK